MQWPFKSALLILLFIGGESFAQTGNDWAFGVKVGEPFGINIRKYIKQGDNAIDLNIGTYGFLYGKTKNYRKGKYDGSGLSIQGLYSVNRFILKSNNLHTYAGFGGQINSRTYYKFKDNAGNFDRDAGNKSLSIGPAVNVGIEYNLPTNALSIFADAGAYAELIPDILFFQPQISAGARLNLGH